MVISSQAGCTLSLQLLGVRMFVERSAGLLRAVSQLSEIAPLAVAKPRDGEGQPGHLIHPRVAATCSLQLVCYYCPQVKSNQAWCGQRTPSTLRSSRAAKAVERFLVRRNRNNFH